MMSKTVRPEVSEKNDYYLSRNRYFELKYFCLQYPTWRGAYQGLDGLSHRPLYLAGLSETNRVSDPTGRCVEAKAFFFERMAMVERAARATDEALASYILEGVTEGLSYDEIKARRGIPCCRDTYYRLYRRFFWLLNRERE